MSIGGELYITCDGEVQLGSAFRYDDEVRCRMTGPEIEVDDNPTAMLAAVREQASRDGWIRMPGGDLCPVCSATRARLTDGT